MNTADYVDEQITILKNKGIPYQDAVWELAQLCIGWPYIFGDRGEYCKPEKREAVHKAHPNNMSVIEKCQAIRPNNPTGSCSGCKWYPNGHRVRSYDCRGFTYWVLLKIYGWKLMGTGCTAQWNTESNWKAKGEVSDGIPSNVIVCLFYYKKDKNGKRTSTLEHTGLYYNGETIECSNGVQYSKTLNKKWEVWGIPACVTEGGDQPMPGPTPDTKPTLRRGSKGEYVTLAQTMLLNKGYDLGKCGVDGDFGKATEEAVKRFQIDHGLTADGVIGPKTWDALDQQSPVTILYSVTVPSLTKYQAEALLARYPGSSMVEERR